MATPTSRFDRILNLFQETFHLSHSDALKATVEFEKIFDENKNKSEKTKSFFSSAIFNWDLLLIPFYISWAFIVCGLIGKLFGWLIIQDK